MFSSVFLWGTILGLIKEDIRSLDLEFICSPRSYRVFPNREAFGLSRMWQSPGERGEKGRCGGGAAGFGFRVEKVPFLCRAI